MSDALVGKSLVTTANVGVSLSSDPWTADISFTLPLYRSISGWYEVTFTDPGTGAAANFAAVCQTNVPIEPNATLR